MDMDILNKPIKTQTKKDTQEIRERQKEKEQQLNPIKELPEPVIKLGWIQHKKDNIYEVPYPYDNEHSFIYTRDDKQYLVAFYNIENPSNKFVVGGYYAHKHFIDVNVPDRNRRLGKVVELNQIGTSGEKPPIVKYLNDISNTINKYGLKEILDYNHEVLKNLEDLEDTTQQTNDKFQLPHFEDYPEDVQKEAKKLNEKGFFLKNLIYSTSVTHEGDISQIKNDYLSTATLFIGKSAHKIDGGETGVGKTDKRKEVLSNIPDQYINSYRTVSPRFIFYDKDNLHPKYNIFDFDDLKEKEDTIEVIKVLSDNKDKNKELKTVSKDRDSKTFKIPPNALVNLNLAKQLSDTEMLNRFFLDDIDGKESHKIKVKTKIRNNEVYNVDDSTILKRLRLINKCAWQDLIDKEMSIFNPYLLFLDVEDINNRNIKGYVAHIQARTFFEYYQRDKINNVVIGNFEDFKFIANKIKKESIKQNYKLNGIQEQIINLIPVITEEEAQNIQDKAIDDLEQARINACTYDTLIKKTGKSKTTIINAVNGIKGSTQNSLIEQGFINRKEFQPTTHRRDVFLYKTKDSKKLANDNTNTNQVVYKENKLCFDTLNKKISLLYAFFSNHNIIINTQLKKITHTFCEKNNENLNSYLKIFNFLNEFFGTYKNNLIYSNENSNLTNEEIKFHFNHISKFQKKSDLNVCIHNSSENYENMITKNSKEKNLNQKQNTKKRFKNEINHIDLSLRDNEDLRREIEKEIFENVQNKGITNKTQLINSITTDHQTQEEHFNYIKTILNNLSNKDYIEIDRQTIGLTELFLDYYNDELVTIPEVVTDE